MGIIKILLKKKKKKMNWQLVPLYNAILCITLSARIWISRLNLFESYITVTGKTITEGVKFPELHNYSELFRIYLRPVFGQFFHNNPGGEWRCKK